MNKPEFSNDTGRILKLTTLSTLALAIAIQFALTGCASVNRREETIDAILARENVLIEKVKLERAQPEVSKAVQKNERLKKAEAHLELALEELLKANEVITMKLIKQSKKEVLIERHEASGR